MKGSSELRDRTDTLLCIQLYLQAVEYSHGNISGLDQGSVLLRKSRRDRLESHTDTETAPTFSVNLHFYVKSDKKVDELDAEKWRELSKKRGLRKTERGQLVFVFWQSLVPTQGTPTMMIRWCPGVTGGHKKNLLPGSTLTPTPNPNLKSVDEYTAPFLMNYNYKYVSCFRAEKSTDTLTGQWSAHAERSERLSGKITKGLQSWKCQSRANISICVKKTSNLNVVLQLTQIPLKRKDHIRSD